MKCPRCYKDSCSVISDTVTSGKDYSASKGCCGVVFFWWLIGPFSLLCGACGKGKQVHTKNYWICHDCGKKFRL